MWTIGACHLPLLAAAAAASNTAAGAQAAIRGHEGIPPIPTKDVPLLHITWESDDVVSSDEFRVKLFLACRESAEGHPRLACEATETPKVYCNLIRQLRQRQPVGRSLRNGPAPGHHGKAVLAATSAKPPDTAGSVSNATVPKVVVAAGSPFTACLRFPMDMGYPNKTTPFVQCLEQAAEEDGCRDSGNSLPQDVSNSSIEDQERSGGTVHDDAGTKMEENSTSSMLPQKKIQRTEPRRILFAAQRLRGQRGNSASAQLPKWWNGGKNSDLGQGPPESVMAAKALHAAAAVAAAIGKGQASTEAMTASEAATAALATSRAAASASSKALTMAKGAVAEVSKLRAHMKANAEAKAAALRKLEGDAPGFFGRVSVQH